MIDNNDIFNLMFRLRGGLARDMYGMQHEGLFSKSIVGTKHLVEEYHKTVVDALNCICDSNPDEDEVVVFIDFLKHVRFPKTQNLPFLMKRGTLTDERLYYSQEVQL